MCKILIWEARIDLDMYNMKMISLNIRHSETRYFQEC